MQWSIVRQKDDSETEAGPENIDQTSNCSYMGQKHVLKLNDKKIGLRERKHRGRKQEHLTRLQLMYNVLPIITRGCLRKNLEWWRQTVEQKKTIISNFEPQERLGPAPYGSFVSPRIAMQVSPGISPV